MKVLLLVPSTAFISGSQDFVISEAKRGAVAQPRAMTSGSTWDEVYCDREITTAALVQWFFQNYKRIQHDTNILKSSSAMIIDIECRKCLLHLHDEAVVKSS